MFKSWFNKEKVDSPQVYYSAVLNLDEDFQV
jgi:hypothetical protein